MPDNKFSSSVDEILETLKQQRAAELLPVICASLRAEAKKAGRDLDAMIAADADLAAVAKSVTVE